MKEMQCKGATLKYYGLSLVDKHSCRVGYYQVSALEISCHRCQLLDTYLNFLSSRPMVVVQTSLTLNNCKYLSYYTSTVNLLICTLLFCVKLVYLLILSLSLSLCFCFSLSLSLSVPVYASLSFFLSFSPHFSLYFSLF